MEQSTFHTGDTVSHVAHNETKEKHSNETQSAMESPETSPGGASNGNALPTDDALRERESTRKYGFIFSSPTLPLPESEYDVASDSVGSEEWESEGGMERGGVEVFGESQDGDSQEDGHDHSLEAVEDEYDYEGRPGVELDKRGVDAVEKTARLQDDDDDFLERVQKLMKAFEDHRLHSNAGADEKLARIWQLRLERLDPVMEGSIVDDLIMLMLGISVNAIATVWQGITACIRELVVVIKESLFLHPTASADKELEKPKQPGFEPLAEAAQENAFLHPPTNANEDFEQFTKLDLEPLDPLMEDEGLEPLVHGVQDDPFVGTTTSADKVLESFRLPYPELLNPIMEGDHLEQFRSLDLEPLDPVIEDGIAGDLIMLGTPANTSATALQGPTAPTPSDSRSGGERGAWRRAQKRIPDGASELQYRLEIPTHDGGHVLHGIKTSANVFGVASIIRELGKEEGASEESIERTIKVS